jgi:hypothetical protein
MEVLAFLIYETVAQIVDLAFIIKRERMGSSNPIQRLCDNRGVNPDTCMSAPAFQVQQIINIFKMGSFLKEGCKEIK